jgi:hypothetical protein
MLSRLDPEGFYLIMRATTAELNAGLGRLGQVLGCSDPRRISTMLQICPRLLLAHPKSLRHALGELRSCTGLSQTGILFLLLRAPALLMSPPGRLPSTCASIMCHLDLTEVADLGRVCSQQPNLLKWEKQGLADKIAELRSCLGLSGREVSALVRGQPALLGMSAVHLGAKLVHLVNLLHLDRDAADPSRGGQGSGAGGNSLSMESGQAPSRPGWDRMVAEQASGEISGWPEPELAQIKSPEHSKGKKSILAPQHHMTTT